jgi:3-oxocholest-4-en-26-oyl-CoA dehydrogenase alpha subunit
VDFAWPAEVQAFRQEIRAFLRDRWSPDLQQEIDSVSPYHPADPPNPPTQLLDALRNELLQLGWPFRSLPVDLGGKGDSPWFQFVLTYELRMARIPFSFGAMTLFGPAIMRFGTPEQRREYIPRIFSGEMTLALGYSEPGAGTDLASLTTRAIRDGDDYVINGQKVWTSDAHETTHVWLAVRTDPEAPKHRGISVFIVPLDTPGITIRPIWTMCGVRTNETFWEDVRVPATTRIGEENNGWYIVANALDNERVMMGINDYAEVTFIFDQLVEVLGDSIHEPVVRNKLGEFRMEIAVLRSLVLRNAAIVASGDTPTMEASMVKVWGTELRHRLASQAMDLVGRRAALRAQSGFDAPAMGRLEASFRYAPVLRFAGGTNEIQRNIIAQRGLGLPR